MPTNNEIRQIVREELKKAMKGIQTTHATTASGDKITYMKRTKLIDFDQDMIDQLAKMEERLAKLEEEMGMGLVLSMKERMRDLEGLQEKTETTIREIEEALENIRHE